MSSNDRELPDESGVLLSMYDERSFSRDAMARFPDLRTSLEPHNGLLHVQMSVLGRALLDALRSREMAPALDIFQFLDAVLQHPRAIGEIPNAVSLSFVTADEILAAPEGEKLLPLMPEAVRNCLSENNPS